MFYAAELYWGDINDKKQSAENYTLDLAKSSCTPDTFVTQGGNITSVVYVLLKKKKLFFHLLFVQA
jgi:hypothetical protein